MVSNLWILLLDAFVDKHHDCFAAVLYRVHRLAIRSHDG